MWGEPLLFHGVNSGKSDQSGKARLRIWQAAWFYWSTEGAYVLSRPSQESCLRAHTGKYWPSITWKSRPHFGVAIWMHQQKHHMHLMYINMSGHTCEVYINRRSTVNTSHGVKWHQMEKNTMSHERTYCISGKISPVSQESLDHKKKEKHLKEI